MVLVSLSSCWVRLTAPPSSKFGRELVPAAVPTFRLAFFLLFLPFMVFPFLVLTLLLLPLLLLLLLLLQDLMHSDA